MGDRSRPDHWARRAKAEGYASRSAYKLEEIHRRFSVVPRGGRVLDLGCCPGGWSTFVLRAGGPRTRLVGLDLVAPRSYPGVFVGGSVLETDPGRVLAALGGPADLVLSDMAPSTTGSGITDHARQVELARAALRLAGHVLRPGGGFVVKVFDGEDAEAFLLEVRERFLRVRRTRPRATRTTSREFFVVAAGRR